MSSDVPRTERHDLLSSVPDLADEPLEALWFRRSTGEWESPPQTPPQTPDQPASIPSDDTPKKKRKKRRWPRILGFLAFIGLLAIGGIGLYAKRQFDRVERVEISSLLAAPSPGGTNYLIVGTDSRENLDPNVENAGAIFGDGTVDFGGQRTDTIQILRLNADGTQHMLALPRDLYVAIPGRGQERINAAFAFGGPELLLQTIEGSLGIPIHHYAEVDFAGFIDLVDAVGGVTIDFPNPAYDLKTGLNVPAGPVELDSAGALAYVRSRTYTEVIDGQNVVSPGGDLGRVKRQQAFLQSLFAELGSPRSQVALLANLDAPIGSFRIDDSLTFTEAASTANLLRNADLNTEWDLTVSFATTPTGASVLAFDREASQPTLDFFSR